MISIIVPVYNVSAYLRECIDSVLRQTYADFELLLVDDGSTDDSLSVCEAYEKQDSRIRVIRKEHGGLADTRNAGTRVAQGEYITFVDSDDVLHSDYLRCLADGIQEQDADISVCAYESFFDTAPAPAESSFLRQNFICLSGREACDRIVNAHEMRMIIACCKLYKSSLRDLLYMPVGKIHEDEFTVYKILYSAKTVAVTDSKRYFYRRRKNSLSTDVFSLRKLDKLEALLGAADWLEAQGDEELHIHARKRYLLGIEIMWRKAKLGGAEPALLDGLTEDHRRCFEQYGKPILNCCSFLEKFTMTVFRISPALYRLMSGVYIILFGED